MATISKRAPENLDDALLDVETRFLYSLPSTEMSKTDRLFFQIEQAYWYYEDFKADCNPSLPHFSSLKSFAKKIFEHCPLLQELQASSSSSNAFQELFETYSNYKSKIPVCGCILMNPSLTKILLVCNWDGKSWSFPRGKIDENETEYHCAIREVYEETGFNPKDFIQENDFLICFQDQKKIQLFIGMGVPEDTQFISKTRKEISKIEFFDINNLPKTTFLVHPFIPKLRRWIDKKQKAMIKQLQQQTANRSPYLTALTGQQQQTNNLTTGSKKLLAPTSILKANKGGKEKDGIAAGDKFSSPKVPKRRPNSHTIDDKNADTFSFFSSGFGEAETAMNPSSKGNAGWSVEEMFQANSKITGKEYDYDGNPHSFGSSHPKFVNYRDYSELRKHRGVNNSNNKFSDGSDVDFQNFSLQSQKLGEKLLRGRGGSDLDNFSLPSSNYQPTQGQVPGKKNWKPTFFQLPFKLNSQEILEAIDLQLLNFSFE